MKIGVTGGIGSGKTSVCRVFNVLGIPVFSSDAVARRIMDSDDEIIEKVKTIAGKDVYFSGTLDRAKLAGIIFNNASLLEEINKIVHPVVFEQFNIWVNSVSAPYSIMEAAILIESGASKLVDKIATIATPEEERLSRVTLRSRLSRHQVMERMKNQLDDETRIKLSDYVIYNSENDMIIPAIIRIHEDILINLKTVN